MIQQKASGVSLKGNKMTVLNDLKTTLAERLKRVREELEMSQKELAVKLGISFRAWQGYELGKNVPGSSVIEELVKLGFNANWILTGKGIMKTSVEKEFYKMLDGAFGKRAIQVSSRISIVLNEYMKNDANFSQDAAEDMNVILFAILFKKDDAFLTDENILLAVKALRDIYKAFDILKEIGTNDIGIIEITKCILNPERMNPQQIDVDLLYDVQKDCKKA